MGPLLGVVTSLSCRVMSLHVMWLCLVMLFLPLLTTETHVERRVNSTFFPLNDTLNGTSSDGLNHGNGIREKSYASVLAIIDAKDILESKDGPCNEKQGHLKSPCFRGFRYGCEDNKCWRTWTQKSKIRKFFYNNRNHRGFAKCKTSIECLHIWQELEASYTGDIPCLYDSIGYEDEFCFRGIRYGCDYRWSPPYYYCWQESSYTFERNRITTAHYEWGKWCGKSNTHRCVPEYWAVAKTLRKQE